jgi:hypothetical protein
MLETRLQVNWWMVYALILTGLIGVAILVPNCFMEPGREKSIASTERLLKLAGKRDFDGMAAIASPGVVDFMRERDAKWGKVVMYSFEDSIVQLGGTPAQVWYRVWRERKNVRENFTATATGSRRHTCPGP